MSADVCGKTSLITGRGNRFSRFGAGIRCEATRVQVFLDGGSTACRSRAACLALLRTPTGEILALRLGRSRG
jgi:hypothetical protein